MIWLPIHKNIYPPPNNFLPSQITFLKEYISKISLCFHQHQTTVNKLRLQISKVKEVLIQTNISKLLFLLIDLISQVEEWEMERETGFEPATSTLARLRSTSWAILAFAVKWINSIL